MAKNTKDVIYQGAVEAFSELGFTATSMDYIAEKSGVVKRTLYYNFKTKEELFSYVMQRAAEELEDVLDRSLDEKMNFSEKWQNVVAAHLDFYSNNNSFFHLVVQQIWKKNIGESFAIHHVFKNYFARLDREIERDQQAGCISQDLDRFTCSAAIFGLLTIPVARAMLNGQTVNDKKRVETITTMILNSIQQQGEMK